MFYILKNKRLFIFFLFLLCFVERGYSQEELTLYNIEGSDRLLLDRPEHLESMREAFQQGHSLITLCGISGIGKTQLAKKYAQTFQDEYQIIWVFNFNEDIFEQFKRFAQALNRLNFLKIPIVLDQVSLEYLVYQVKESLRTLPKKWLFIYDDVQAYETVSPYIFENQVRENGQIIITSKNEFCWKKIIKIKELSREQSKKLVQMITNLKEDKDTERFAALLCDYPLALSQAALFIRSSGMKGYKEYISLFKKERQALWKKEEQIYKKRSQFHEYHRTVFTTIRMAMQDLKKQSPHAYELYGFLSVLHKEEIYEDLLKEIYYGYINKTANAEADFQKDIGILLEEGLLQRKDWEEGEDRHITYSLHEMHQTVLEDILGVYQKKILITKTALLLSKRLDMNWDKLTQDLFQNPGWILHVETVLENAREVEFISEPILLLKLRMLEYNLYLKRDNNLYEKQVHELKNLLKKQSINDTDLAKFYIDGIYDRAMHEDPKENETYRAHLEWALHHLKSQKGELNEYFRGLFTMGTFYLFSNRLTEASAYIDQAEALLGRIESRSYQNLFRYTKSWVLFEKGDYQASYDELAEFMEKDDRETNPSLKLYSLNMMASCLFRLKDYEKAYSVAKIAFDQSKKLYLHDVSEVIAEALLVMASCEKERGHLDEAIKLSQDCIAVYEKYFGGDLRHQDQINPRILLGDIYFLKGELEFARVEYETAEKVLEKLFSDKNSLLVGGLYQKLFTLYIHLKEEGLAHQILKTHRDVFGIQNERTQEMMQVMTGG